MPEGKQERGIAEGVAPGKRLEVLWDLEIEEGKVESTWWPCKAVSLSDRAMEDAVERGIREGEEKGQIWDVRYDPHDAFDYEGDDLLAELVFVSEHKVFDTGADDVLPWRFEGSAWMPAEKLAAESDAKEAEKEDAAHGMLADENALPVKIIPVPKEDAQAAEEAADAIRGAALEALAEEKAYVDAMPEGEEKEAAKERLAEEERKAEAKAEAGAFPELRAEVVVEPVDSLTPLGSAVKNAFSK